MDLKEWQAMSFESQMAYWKKATQPEKIELITQFNISDIPGISVEHTPGWQQRIEVALGHRHPSQVTASQEEYEQPMPASFTCPVKEFTADVLPTVCEALGCSNSAQLLEGLNVELEHCDVTGGDLIMTAKIAMAHLREDPDYYTKLKKAGL